MLKKQVRKTFRENRKNLSAEEVSAKSRDMVELLFSRIPVHHFSVVHTFLPIEKNNEPDTHIIINTLRQDFPLEIFISKSLENGDLLHVPFTANTPLKENQWGIQEPVDLSAGISSEEFFNTFSSEEILVLIPLLAFDKWGNRVGYGKGFYDRFLGFSGENTLKVGLSLFDPVGQISDVSPFDIKMDFCITPTKVWQWKKQI